MISLRKFIANKRWLICCLFIFVEACENKTLTANNSQLLTANSAALEMKTRKAFGIIEEAKPLIKKGDLILRTGNDFTSESLRQFSFDDKTYSHCGIASIENDSIFVYHSIGGEWNPDEKLRRDPIELFCNPFENRGFGLFSFALNTMQINKLDSIVKNWYKKGIMFDMNFDMVSEDKMYCSEFVSKAVIKSTNGTIDFPTSKINNFNYVALDNLFLNDNCKQKLRVRY